MVILWKLVLVFEYSFFYLFSIIVFGGKSFNGFLGFGLGIFFFFVVIFFGFIFFFFVFFFGLFFGLGFVDFLVCVGFLDVMGGMDFVCFSLLNILWNFGWLIMV